jgi:beta-N-acetylhexosaminidase
MSDLDTCLLARFPGPRVPGWLRRWLDDGLGGVLLFAENITGPGQLRDLVAELRSHQPGVLIAADEEGGDITRIEARAGSSYPGHAALGAIGDPALTQQVAASLGAMLARAGVNLALAPVADLGSNPANPVIGVRSFGADPAQVAAHTAAFVAGLQSNLVAACAKHFPGHGGTDADSHLTRPAVPASLAELRAADLVPFRAAVGAGVRSVMTAHVVFPAVDDLPATISRRFLDGVLRTELGFGGVIITDALGMAAISDGVGSAEGAVRSLAAGADLLCLPADPAGQQQARDTLAGAIRDGDLPGDRVQEAAARVRELAAWARPRPAVPPDPDLGPAAARRALLVGVSSGRLPLPGPPYVLDAGGTGLLGVLRGRAPDADGIRLTEPTAHPAGLGALIARAAGRPLVVAVRDAHRRPWQAELISRVLARRPDAVVVGTGTAHDQTLAPGRYLGTRGSGRASLVAAVDLLLSPARPDGPG